MTVPILCLVALVLVVWVLMLMSENRGLKQDVTKLKLELKDRLDQKRLNGEVRAGRRLTAGEVDRAVQTALRK